MWGIIPRPYFDVREMRGKWKEMEYSSFFSGIGPALDALAVAF
jgi:hypothetical protein